MSAFHRPTSIDFRQNASFSVHNAVQMSKNSHTHLRNRMFYAEKLTRTVQNLTNCYFYTEPTGTLSTKNVQKTKNRKYRPNCFKKLYWVLKRVLSTKNGKGQACRFYVTHHIIRQSDICHGSPKTYSKLDCSIHFCGQFRLVAQHAPSCPSLPYQSLDLPLSLSLLPNLRSRFVALACLLACLLSLFVSLLMWKRKISSRRTRDKPETLQSICMEKSRTYSMQKPLAMSFFQAFSRHQAIAGLTPRGLALKAGVMEIKPAGAFGDA